MQEADSWGSASVDGKFDRTQRIGDCRRGRMLSGKALDAHVNVEAELKTYLWIKLSNREKKSRKDGPGRVPFVY
jgi:hypothetical protein